MGFKLDLGKIEARIDAMPKKMDRAMRALTGYQASRGATYMKTNAPWTDRTGNARAGLFTVPEFPGDKYVIVFSHTMHYGIWLEIANSGKYQIIMPSVRKIGNDFMADTRKMFREI